MYIYISHFNTPLRPHPTPQKKKKTNEKKKKNVKNGSNIY